MASPDASYRPAAPLHVVWLATGACGLRCAHCSSSAGRARPDELTTAEVRTLIEDLSDAGVVDLAVSGGDPLLRRDLPGLVRHAKDCGLTVGLGSSGLGISKRLALLAAAGLDRLQISIDGSPAEHDRLRGHPGLHAKAVAAIREARAIGLRVNVCCTVHARNRATIGEVIELAISLGVFRVNLSRYVPTGRATASLDMGRDAWREVIVECHSLQERYAGRIQIVTHLAQRILLDPDVGRVPGFAGCQAGRGQACVTADGTVWPCVMLPIPLGNVRQARFAQIWRSAELVGALSDRSRLEGVCRDCGVRERCGGCRAVAFAHTGDPLAADPRCWVASNHPGTVSTDVRSVEAT